MGHIDDWDPSVDLSRDTGYTEKDVANLMAALDEAGQRYDQAAQTNSEWKALREARAKQSDPVDNPAHYQTPTGLEAIDVIEAFFIDDFLLGNVFKYIARAGRKHDRLEDLKKARWYLAREIDREENLLGGHQ